MIKGETYKEEAAFGVCGGTGVERSENHVTFPSMERSRELIKQLSVEEREVEAIQTFCDSSG
jgi:hypothetical protein